MTVNSARNTQMVREALGAMRLPMGVTITAEPNIVIPGSVRLTLEVPCARLGAAKEGEASEVKTPTSLQDPIWRDPHQAGIAGASQMIAPCFFEMSHFDLDFLIRQTVADMFHKIITKEG